MYGKVVSINFVADLAELLHGWDFKCVKLDA